MSKMADWRLEKAKLRMGAANAKPERPRVQEQLGLEKNLLELQEKNSAPDKEIDSEMYNKLSEKWKGNEGGSSGDALIEGLQAGLKKGSFAEDKARNKKVMEFTEQMKNMVAKQNEQLFQAEKLDNARQSVTPRIMAYLDGYKTMSPNDRNVYLRNTLEEYNQSAGTDYKLVDAFGSEPWKIIISDGGEPQPMDLMNFIKTPEEQKLNYYLNSNEAQQSERELQADDNLHRQNLQSQVKYNESRANEKQPQDIQEKKRNLIESGEIPEGALLFDELEGHELKLRLDEMKDEKAKGKDTNDALDALYEMGKILEKHPNISTSLAKWANSKDDTLAGNFINTIVNQDTRNALKELEKHAGTLAVGAIQQFKGQRPTDILKKLSASTVPNASFTYKAFVPIAEQIEKRLQKQSQRSLEAERGFMKRYVPTYQSKNSPTQAATENKTEAPSSSIGSLDAMKKQREDVARQIEELRKS